EDGPAWQVAPPTLNVNGKGGVTDRVPGQNPALRQLAFHPVIVNNQVLIADHRSVASYHLATGKLRFRYTLADIEAGIDAKVALPRFTLSADHERAYVRLGKPGMGTNEKGASYLVCLDLKDHAVAKLGSERELW